MPGPSLLGPAILLGASIVGLILFGIFLGREFVHVFLLEAVANADWGRWPIRMAWTLFYAVLSIALAKHIHGHAHVEPAKIASALVPWLAALGVGQALAASNLFGPPLVFAARPPLIGLTAIAGVFVLFRAGWAAERWAKDRDWRVALGPLFAALVLVWYGYAILYHDQPPGLNFWIDPIVPFTLLLSGAPLIYAHVRSRTRIGLTPAVWVLTLLSLANALFLTYFWFAEDQPWARDTVSPRPVAMGVGAAYAAVLVLLGVLARWGPADSWAMRPFRSGLSVAVWGGQGFYGLAHALIAQTDPGAASRVAQTVIAWGDAIGVPAPGFTLWFPLNLLVGYGFAAALESDGMRRWARLGADQASVAALWFIWFGLAGGLRDLLMYAMGS